MSGAGVGAVLDALVALYTAAGAPADVAVIDGNPTDPPRRFLCVGWDESDQPAVVASRALADANLAFEQELLAVSCLLTCWQGSETAQQLRDETLAIYDTFEAALAADRQLGGAAMLARVSTYEFLPDSRAEGRLAQVRFTVAVQSLN